MTWRISLVRSAFLVAVLMTAVPTVYAQAPGEFATEPDKDMANAHESFVKGDMNKAAEHIKKAAAYVHKEGIADVGQKLEQLNVGPTPSRSISRG